MAIQIRRGTEAQWESNKSHIVEGEPAVTTDTGRFFVGTGSGTYAEFPNTDSIVDMIYPVGSIYMSVNNTDPTILFGGTWVQIKDTFLLSAGENYAAGATGGEAEHSLSSAEMPSHNHNLVDGGNSITVHNTSGVLFTQGLQGSPTGYWYNANKGESKIANAGGGQAHNNMPPYLVVYMWKRTA